MKDILKEILFSRNLHSVDELHRKVDEGAISRDELVGVLGATVADAVLDCPRKSSYPSGKNILPKKRKGDYNQIVFWGSQGCGKTSVIAALLSLPGIDTTGLNSDDIQARINALTSTFKETSPQVMPQERSSVTTAYYAKYKKGHRTYLLSFIEANDREKVRELIGKDYRSLVHVFCVDSRGDLDNQIKQHEETIGQVGKDLLGKSSGLYILVTKADLMNAPKVYLDNAAQAMITASAQAFWQHVRNKCGENDIYNEQPIVCSVGDFILKDYATPTTEYTSRLFHCHLLPKCEHKHWGLVGLLRKMGRIPALLTVVLLLIAAGTGITLVLDAISQPPTRALQPFDYSAYFSNEITQNLQADAAYEIASEQYWRLRNDLTIEGRMRQNNNEYVLSRDDLKTCDSRLSNAFADIITRKLKSHFDSSTWTEDSILLRQSHRDLQDLVKHKAIMSEVNSTTCVKQLGYLKAYNDSVLPLISTSKNCQSLGVLNGVREKADYWNQYPFSNDSTLHEDLINAVFNAYVSYSGYLLERAEQVKQSYDDLSFWGRLTDSYQERNLEERAEGIYDIADQLLEQLNEDADEDDTDYSAVKRRLESVQNILYNIIN